MSGPAPQHDPVARLDAAARHERTRCGAGELVWRIWGSGLPTVLLHGGHGSWKHWLRNIEPLVAQGRQLLVPDMPGYGESAELAPPPGASIDGPMIAQPLAQGLDTLLGDATCDIVGFSFGGFVGGFVTAQRRERVRRLVLVGAGGLGLMSERRVPMRSWRGLDGAELDDAHRFNLQALMIADPAAIDPLALRLQRENTQAARYTDSRSLAVTDALARILDETRPSLAGIWGEHDVTVRGRLDAVEARLRRAQPALHWQVVPQAGHWVQYERPREFEAALRDALA